MPLLLFVGCNKKSLTEEFRTQIELEMQEYLPYIWEPYHEFTTEDRYYPYIKNLDSIPLVNNQNDTMMFAILANIQNGTFIVNDQLPGDSEYNLEIYSGAVLELQLGRHNPNFYIRVAFEWNTDYEAATIHRSSGFTYNLYAECTEEKKHDDILELISRNGDYCILQKNVGIVEIHCAHDDITWRPVK